LKSFQEAFAKQGWKISPSVANFSMIDCGIESNAIQLTNDLEKRGIIVRRLGGFRLPHCIRISTGTDDTNQRVILTMQELIAHYA
jgi:histidinol-phosphate aminotransferase